MTCNMAIEKKHYESIQKSMGSRSAKEFVKASERTDAKNKAIHAAMGDKKKKPMTDAQKRDNVRTVLKNAMEKSNTSKKPKKNPIVPGKY